MDLVGKQPGLATKGALAIRARRLAISVFPTPVGPIIRIFLGVISVRSSASSTCDLRQRLRKAMVFVTVMVLFVGFMSYALYMEYG